VNAPEERLERTSEQEPGRRYCDRENDRNAVQFTFIECGISTGAGTRAGNTNQLELVMPAWSFFSEEGPKMTPDSVPPAV